MLGQYRFGSSELRPSERQLFIDGAPAASGARAFDLLLALIERRDRVVAKGRAARCLVCLGSSSRKATSRCR